MKKEGLAKEAIPTKETPKGMSKRFYAACMALNGLLSNPDVDRFGTHNGDCFDVVYQAYRIADRMLKEELIKN